MTRFAAVLALAGAAALAVAGLGAEPARAAPQSDYDIACLGWADAITSEACGDNNRQYVEAIVELETPLAVGGRFVTQEWQEQQWDCTARTYRVVHRTQRTESGQFVRSDRTLDPWSPIPDRVSGQSVCPQPIVTKPVVKAKGKAARPRPSSLILRHSRAAKVSGRRG